MKQSVRRGIGVLSLALAMVLAGATVEAGQLANVAASPEPAVPAPQFVVEDGTLVAATLNVDLSTKNVREGARFTAYVTSPARYRGATIYGHVSDVKRSGRVKGSSEMTLRFTRIRLRGGRTYDFAGAVESVRTPDGESVEVDSEGEVQEDSQTGRTAKRAGVGAVVGTVIGAIAGGGKGAAVGAVVGGGAGAGSVLVQGRRDLDLERGTRLVIRAGAPR